MVDDIIIFGAGGGASTAFRYFDEHHDYNVVGFTLDDENLIENSFMDKPIVPFSIVEKEYPVDNYQLFILLGFDNLNLLRRKKYLEGKAKGYRFASYVEPTNNIHHSVSLGENCFILDGQTINHETKIGNNVVMWSGNHIGDRTLINDHTWITSNVCIGGDSEIGSSSFLGMNCTISHNTKIGNANIIGAGTLITQNTQAEEVYIQTNTKPSGFNSLDFARML